MVARPLATVAARAARDLPSQVAAWSNDELVRWLLDNDLKLLVPAVIRNQICGESIMNLDAAGQELRELVQYTAEEMTELQLKSIFLRLTQLQRLKMDPTGPFSTTTPPAATLPAPGATGPMTIRPASPTAEQRERCVSISSKIESIEEKTTSKLLHLRNRPAGRGWSFEKQRAAWLAYQHAYVERTIAIHIIARQKKVKDMLALIVLAISSITTVITTSTVSVGLPAAIPTLSSANLSSTLSAAARDVDMGTLWRDFSPVLLLLLSIVTTLVSGTNKLFEPDWREREEACRQRIRFLEELEELYEQELAHPVPERSAYDTYCAAERELRRGEAQLPALNVRPCAHGLSPHSAPLEPRPCLSKSELRLCRCSLAAHSLLTTPVLACGDAGAAVDAHGRHPPRPPKGPRGVGARLHMAGPIARVALGRERGRDADGLLARRAAQPHAHRPGQGDARRRLAESVIAQRALTPDHHALHRARLAACHAAGRTLLTVCVCT